MRFWLVAVVLLITTAVDMRGQSSSIEKTTMGEQKKLEIADQLHGETLPSETEAALQHFRSASELGLFTTQSVSAMQHVTLSSRR